MDFQRFLDAQGQVWDEVQNELRAGRKTSHWMWFVFPQLAALGRSSTSKFYGLADARQARAFLAHPVLGPRLVHCCELLLATGHHEAAHIFGEVDAMKLRSCLTLFQAVAPHEGVFGRCLQQFFQGAADASTLQYLGHEG